MTHLSGVLRRLLRELHQQGIITEDLCLPEDFDDLELVYRGLCRKDANSPRRRIGMCRASVIVTSFIILNPLP